MFDELLEVQSLSIVFLGDFNPVIISPAWLALKELIREEEALNADVLVIHKDLVHFELDWVTILINRKRCEFKTTKKPYFDAVRDLSSEIFKILQETPIVSIGLNHIFELRLKDEQAVYKFGSQLTTLSLWEDELNDPRVLSLEIIETERKDGELGRYRLRITPTGEKIKFGVAININDHIDLNGSNASLKLLEHWNHSFHRSRDMASRFVEKIKL